MTPDYQRIAELEYELGFSDEPPPARPSRAQSARTVDSMLKEMWTQPIRDAPGQVIFYEAPADVVETMHRPGRGGYGGQPGGSGPHL